MNGTTTRSTGSSYDRRRGGSTSHSDLWTEKLELHDRKLELFEKLKPALWPAMVHRRDIRRDQIGDISEFQLFQLFRPLLYPYMIQTPIRVRDGEKVGIVGTHFFPRRSVVFAPIRRRSARKKFQLSVTGSNFSLRHLWQGRWPAVRCTTTPLLAGNTREVDP